MAAEVLGVRDPGQRMQVGAGGSCYKIGARAALNRRRLPDSLLLYSLAQQYPTLPSYMAQAVTFALINGCTPWAAAAVIPFTAPRSAHL